jgi:hypothetical protein
MDPDAIDQLALAVGSAGVLASVTIGFAKKFGGARFVLAKRFFAALTRLMVALNKKLS